MNWILLRLAWVSAWPRLLVLFLILIAVRYQAPKPNYVGPWSEPSSPAAAATVAKATRPPPPKSKPLPAVRTVDSDAAAARFLAQATFGPSWDDIARVRALGYSGWIDEQTTFPVSSQLRFLNEATRVTGEMRRERRTDAWFLHAVGGTDPFDPAVLHKDQLRQRVAFALSEILVVSDATSDLLGNTPHGVTDYYDTLARGAFGNFRTLLENVTLHPVMGIYLSMMQNQKPDPARNIRPDENYAREILQLFSIGLVRLNLDGTPLLENGQKVPTYTQDTVKGFAHVFTGWTFSGCAREFDCYYYDSDAPAWVRPMENHAAYHASAQSKQLLSYPGATLPGGVLAAGGNGPDDLRAALDNIFHHPNVGPFIGKQLIQRLVTSNPSPAYVGRVAARFNDNGQGVRGDMKAVIKAILLDPEARDVASQPANFGKVREPLLRVTHLWRAMNARSKTWFQNEFWNLGYGVGQAPLYAPSVFNFFSPNYSPMGEPAQLGLVAPELQLATDYMLPGMEGYLQSKIFDFHTDNPDVEDNDIAIDLTREMEYATQPAVLIERLNTLFLSGQMTPMMKSVLLERLNAMPAGDRDEKRGRVQEALYIIVNSPEYVVQK